MGQFACLNDLQLCRLESSTPDKVTHAEQVKG